MWYLKYEVVKIYSESCLLLNRTLSATALHVCYPLYFWYTRGPGVFIILNFSIVRNFFSFPEFIYWLNRSFIACNKHVKRKILWSHGSRSTRTESYTLGNCNNFQVRVEVLMISAMGANAGRLSRGLSHTLSATVINFSSEVTIWRFRLYWCWYKQSFSGFWLACPVPFKLSMVPPVIIFILCR